MTTLKVTSGETTGDTRQLEGPIVIGREAADLTVPDPEVSRRHVQVRPVAGGVEVEDFGSLNGTFVDGERVEGTVTLAASATLRVGTTEIALELPVADPNATRLRPAMPEPDVTRARPIADPDVTAVRPRAAPPGAGQPEPAAPPATAEEPPQEAAPPAPEEPPQEAAPPAPEKPPRNVLPLVFIGTAIVVVIVVFIVVVLVA
jgi:predicted component of type VI protein secretion system